MSRAALVARLIAAVSVVAVLAAAGATLYTFRHAPALHPAAARPATRPSAPSPASLASTRQYLGVFERGVPATYEPVDQFAATVAGRQPDIVSYFSGWYDPFQVRFATAAAAHGAVTLAQMEPRNQSMAGIAAGTSDAYLRTYARAVRAFGGQVILSFAPEADGDWYSWGWRRTPASEWVAAWRHVVTLFRREGAANVTWLWDMSRHSGGTGPLHNYWPGRKYVTWVGLDGYFYTKADTYHSIFGRTIAHLRKFTSAPILISEVAVGPAAGRAVKIPGLFAGIRRDHLLGLLWFDASQHRGHYHQDWRLEGHPAAIAAFRAGIKALHR